MSPPPRNVPRLVSRNYVRRVLRERAGANVRQRAVHEIAARLERDFHALVDATVQNYERELRGRSVQGIRPSELEVREEHVPPADANTPPYTPQAPAPKQAHAFSAREVIRHDDKSAPEVA